MKYLFTLFLLYPHFSFCADTVPLKLLSTVYLFADDSPKPSCALFKHRRLEREKVLREMKHNLSLKNINGDSLLKDDFIMNKFFLEKELWVDETVKIELTWKVPDELSVLLVDESAQPFMHLSADGIDWRASLSMFPEEVSFKWNQEAQILVTNHLTYYVDYCSPRKTSYLKWFPAQAEKPIPSQKEVAEILNQLKEI